MSSITSNGGTSTKLIVDRRRHQALARCLSDLDISGEVAAPFDRAAEFLYALMPTLFDGDADGARAAVLGSDLTTRELLDLILRARMSVRGRKLTQRERTERERAADAALRTLADREDTAHPEDLEGARSGY